MIDKKSMPMFIQRAPPAMFACTFMKTLFTSAATANPILYFYLGKVICLSTKRISLQYHPLYIFDIPRIFLEQK